MEVAATPTSQQLGPKEVPGGKIISRWDVFGDGARVYSQTVLLEDGVSTSVLESGFRNAFIWKAAVESPPRVNQAHEMKQIVGGSAVQETEGPMLQKRLDAIASSLCLLGDTLGTAIEEGMIMVETKANEILTPESRSRVLRKSSPQWKKSPSISPCVALRASVEKSDGAGRADEKDLSGDIQLKASRDVALAMASKAKTLLRELKTVRGDLSFLRDRCAQLEEENRRLRDSVVKGTRPDEDDLVRLQLETLLAEKQRLQQENANYVRENQFLHEVVEYHQIEYNEDELSVDSPDVGLDLNNEELGQMVTMPAPKKKN